jgi:hypothetical protein
MKPSEIKQLCINLARYRADVLIGELNTKLHAHFVNSASTKPFSFTHNSHTDWNRSDIHELVLTYFRQEGWDVVYDTGKLTYTISHPSLIVSPEPIK